MRDWLLPLLACPSCRAPLRRTGENELGCERGSHAFSVVRGIPRFISASSATATGSVFTFEFQQLVPHAPDETIRGQDEIFFFRATGLDERVYAHVRSHGKRTDLTPQDIGYRPDASVVRGALVLDAGCGGGRFTRLLADAGARVVALDLSESVERVAADCAGREDVAVAQGDVMRPPLREEIFDHVFSIGVLHHTPDTRRAFEAIAKLVRPGGTLSVWVYGPDYWGDPVRGAVTRALRRIFLRVSVAWRARIVRGVLLPIGRLQMRLARRRLTKLLFAPLFLLNIPRHDDRELMTATIFDYWSPPHVRTHTAEEVFDWFVSAGYRDVRILPTPVAVRGTRAGPLPEPRLTKH